jgi:hypothetical protein
VKPAKPFDMEDPLFRAYIWVMRTSGVSKHTGPVGVCAGCMPAYIKMKAAYRGKQAFLLGAGIVLAVIYFYLTQNAILSLALGVFTFSLSLLSYCPPLKE